jgi:SWI/SNF-related matrix-associated actin-dependent regulator of chromatin subfamily A3
VFELFSYVCGIMQVVVYHGPERNRSRAWLSRQDVVITTYQTLTQDMGLRGGQGLLGVTWLRLVLDEAHTIRNSETQQAKVCYKQPECVCLYSLASGAEARQTAEFFCVKFEDLA